MGDTRDHVFALRGLTCEEVIAALMEEAYKASLQDGQLPLFVDEGVLGCETGGDPLLAHKADVGRYDDGL